jgi:predicted TIM-barrel fold metal-dependent hydrolase
VRNGFYLFDTHCHLGNAQHSGRSYSVDSLLRDMDSYGIDRSVVIPFPVVLDHRLQHDIIGDAIRMHPDRLTGAACLSPFLPLAEFRDEVHRCRDRYGFRVLKLQPQYHGLNPLNQSSDFFFETALDNKMTVICHTGSGLPFSAPSLYMLPARKFPELKIILGHCGGGIFFHEAIVSALFCPNILLELSTLMPHQVLEVLQHVPSDRLMIGSDLPENVDTEIGKILTLPIAADDKRRILGETALGVFGEAA